MSNYKVINYVRLQQENLYKLYSLYGSKYQYILQNIAIDVLTDETTKWTAYDFFMARGKIKDSLQLVSNFLNTYRN